MTTSQAYNEGMKLIVQVKAEPGEPQALLDMITRFNTACNWLSHVAFNEKLFHWLPLQRRAYHELRERFSLSANAAKVCVRKVAYAYRNKARRNTLATFRPLGAIPLYQHSYRHDGQVRIYGQLYPFISRITLSKAPGQATLSYRDGKFFIHQTIEVEAPELYQPAGFLGCDLGIVNILTDSTGEHYAGGHLNGLRKRHTKLRARLQSRGTRSAKRLLMKRRRKESRFARDVNHCISKGVVEKAVRHSLGIALEDLQGIRERTVVRQSQRRQHHAWAFNQLRQFIEYKAKLRGVPVALVDPRNTSRTCPACGHIEKANRVSQALFSCVRCSFAGNADHIAAVNISRKAVDGRVAGDRPDGASHDSPKSPEGLRVPKG